MFNNKLTDPFLSQETAYKIILGYIDEFIFPNEPANSYEAFRQSVTRTIYKANIDFIFQFAESPIEKIFLGTLLLHNIAYGSYLIKFTEPLFPIKEALLELRNNYHLVMQMWQDFQKINGEGNIEGFMEYITNFANFSEKERNVILHHMIYEYGLKHCNDFHLSLQCQFDDIKVGGKCIRPDIFVWIPSKPEFYVVVECDGYKYHASTSAFIHDRERDRVLRQNGFHVLRFSGREIVNNPLEIAQEFHKYLTFWQNEMFREEMAEDQFTKEQKRN